MCQLLARRESDSSSQTWPEKDPIFAAALGSLAILLDLIRQAINTYALELRRARALGQGRLLDDVMGQSEPFIASHCAALEEAPWSYGGA